MNPEEIDAWYEEQKQELLNKYLKEIEEKKDRKKIEQEFNSNMQKIHKQYEKLYEKSKRQNEIKDRLKRITSIMNIKK